MWSNIYQPCFFCGMEARFVSKALNYIYYIKCETCGHLIVKDNWAQSYDSKQIIKKRIEEIRRSDNNKDKHIAIGDVFFIDDDSGISYDDLIIL